MNNKKCGPCMHIQTTSLTHLKRPQGQSDFLFSHWRRTSLELNGGCQSQTKIKSKPRGPFSMTKTPSVRLNRFVASESHIAKACSVHNETNKNKKMDKRQKQMRADLDTWAHALHFTPTPTGDTHTLDEFMARPCYTTGHSERLVREPRQKSCRD